MPESPPLRIDRGCSTADCSGLPSRMVRLYDVPGEGPWPYCVECATVLARGGDEDCGPFDPIDDAMVERAALAIAWHDGYAGTDVVPSDVYRHQARVVLREALALPTSGERQT